MMIKPLISSLGWFARRDRDFGPVSINRGNPVLMTDDQMKESHPFAYYVAPPPEPKPRIPTQEEAFSEEELRNETDRVEELLGSKFKDLDLGEVERLDLEGADWPPFGLFSA